MKNRTIFIGLFILIRDGCGNELGFFDLLQRTASS